MLYKNYLPARTIEEAVGLLASSERAVLIAGGTDLMVQARSGRYSHSTLVDILHIPELKGILRVGDEIVIRAATTYQEILDSALLRNQAELLIEASTQVGAAQIQHMATIGGNIANASPAGDLLPPLYALNATVSIVSCLGRRVVPIERLITGVRHSDLRHGELITEVRFPVLPPETGSAFLKFGLRQSQAITVVSAACILSAQETNIKSASISVGAASPTAVRCRTAERLLTGSVGGASLFEEGGHAAREDCRPIDDLRGGAAFRQHLVQTLVSRALGLCWERALTQVNRNN